MVAEPGALLQTAMRQLEQEPVSGRPVSSPELPPLSPGVSWAPGEATGDLTRLGAWGWAWPGPRSEQAPEPVSSRRSTFEARGKNNHLPGSPSPEDTVRRRGVGSLAGSVRPGRRGPRSPYLLGRHREMDVALAVLAAACREASGWPRGSAALGRGGRRRALSVPRAPPSDSRSGNFSSPLNSRPRPRPPSLLTARGSVKAKGACRPPRLPGAAAAPTVAARGLRRAWPRVPTGVGRTPAPRAELTPDTPRLVPGPPPPLADSATSVPLPHVTVLLAGVLRCAPWPGVGAPQNPAQRSLWPTAPRVAKRRGRRDRICPGPTAVLALRGVGLCGEERTPQRLLCKALQGHAGGEDNPEQSQARACRGPSLHVGPTQRPPATPGRAGASPRRHQGGRQRPRRARKAARAPAWARRRPRTLFLLQPRHRAKPQEFLHGRALRGVLGPDPAAGYPWADARTPEALEVSPRGSLPVSARPGVSPGRCPPEPGSAGRRPRRETPEVGAPGDADSSAPWRPCKWINECAPSKRLGLSSSPAVGREHSKTLGGPWDASGKALSSVSAAAGAKAGRRRARAALSLALSAPRAAGRGRGAGSAPWTGLQGGAGLGADAEASRWAVWFGVSGGAQGTVPIGGRGGEPDHATGLQDPGRGWTMRQRSRERPSLADVTGSPEPQPLLNRGSTLPPGVSTGVSGACPRKPLRLLVFTTLPGAGAPAPSFSPAMTHGLNSPGGGRRDPPNSDGRGRDGGHHVGMTTPRGRVSADRGNWLNGLVSIRTRQASQCRDVMGTVPRSARGSGLARAPTLSAVPETPPRLKPPDRCRLGQCEPRTRSAENAQDAAGDETPAPETATRAAEGGRLAIPRDPAAGPPPPQPRGDTVCLQGDGLGGAATAVWPCRPPHRRASRGEGRPEPRAGIPVWLPCPGPANARARGWLPRALELPGPSVESPPKATVAVYSDRASVLRSYSRHHRHRQNFRKILD
ncbi:collagen alpha-1(I) chain-like [Talpa occidentalis]|uniref:collagen alpha-1(I) chain-like n=1 Tax=Talpa occidentalis TaxID=50954 RepID=UPI00189012A6|nr:collagen alpha-1(I) chain-like [Talpa occidentalis]